MNLLDGLRELEDEILREHVEHPNAKELLAEIDQMIRDVESGVAAYKAVDGEVVRVPSRA